MFKRAIILAGGKGTRLKPYTLAMPKPLVPIGTMPIIEILIIQLKNNGFTHITLSVNHMAEYIRAFIGDGSKWDIKIDYSLEDKPLSTMGPLKLIADLPENFLVLNGDVLTDLNFSSFFESHYRQKNLFTISSYQRIVKNDYGVLKVNDNQKLIEFKEKPETIIDVSMGVYAVNKKVLNFIPNETFYGFDNLMLDLIKANELPSVLQHKGYWLDIGRPEDYEKAVEEFEGLNLI
ncbi:MAG: nucleotidyltransferase family protein [Salinivirgaceae bacterium]|nr:nucleotidyltransferase family protein [Salinivirgaceae bacterium]